MKGLGYISFSVSILLPLLYFVNIYITSVNSSYGSLGYYTFYLSPWIGIILGIVSLVSHSEGRDKVFAILGIVIGAIIPLLMFLALLLIPI